MSGRAVKAAVICKHVWQPPKSSEQPVKRRGIS
jgi:hypothetical protein